MVKSPLTTHHSPVTYFLAIISGILLFLAYPPFDLSYLAFIALIPLLISFRRKSPFKGAILGFLFGLVFFGGLLFWMNSMRLYGVKVWARPLLWAALVGTQSLYPALFGLLYGRLSRRLPGYNYLSAPILWCGLEFIRSHFPLGGFPWGLLGYSQYFNLPFIQIASFTGVFGISFLIVLSNALIFELITGPHSLKKKILLSTLYSLLLAMLTASGLFQNPYPQRISRWRPFRVTSILR